VVAVIVSQGWVVGPLAPVGALGVAATADGTYEADASESSTSAVGTTLAVRPTPSCQDQ
jgi:hypothetical protein